MLASCFAHVHHRLHVVTFDVTSRVSNMINALTSNINIAALTTTVTEISLLSTWNLLTYGFADEWNFETDTSSNSVYFTCAKDNWNVFSKETPEVIDRFNFELNLESIAHRKWSILTLIGDPSVRCWFFVNLWHSHETFWGASKLVWAEKWVLWESQ